MFLFAPLTSALCEKFGCRRVGFIGGLLTVAGMLASSFAPNLYTLYVTFGMVYGIGTSMCYFPTLRTLPYWFSRQTVGGQNLNGYIKCETDAWIVHFHPLQGWDIAQVVA
ncbi:monocarboxylate transporter 10-like [Paramuricea clavata]|uniref:Monocarboxylate transporter 10-like n=1 Tax=Paramuricea clavata TaxID=317549 RepID=A0A7D9DXK4_PARCT|nr:monocarboxylate transporter 10-like [Paramuricea clavata]